MPSDPDVSVASQASAGVHAHPRPRTWILGIPVDSLRADALMRRVADMVDGSSKRLVCYLNADCANRAASDRAYRAILQRADLVYADGMSIVWASGLTPQPLSERMTLADGVLSLCAVACERKLRLYFLGGRPGVAAEAARRLAKRFPTLQIAGTANGYFHPEEEQRVIRDINAAQPDILLVGFGAPLQEKWLWRNQELLQVPVRWGVGALFEYCAGTLPRAPRWLRERGLEWLYRLMVEPRRLWRRYVLGNLIFVLRVLRLLIADALLVSAAWFAAYGLRAWLNPMMGIGINPPAPYLAAVPLLVGCWLFVCSALGLYRRGPEISLKEEILQAAQASCLGWILSIAAGFLLRELSLGRSVVLMAGPILFVLLVVSRLANRHREIVWQRRHRLHKALIIGTDDFARRVTHDLETQAAGYDVLGFIADSAVSKTTGALAGNLNQLRELVKSESVEDVVVASRRMNLFAAMNLLEPMQGLAANLHIVSPELSALGERLPLDRVAGTAHIVFPDLQPKYAYQATKRFFDLFASAALLLLVAPLFALIAVILRCESDGPVLFIQQRVGRSGRLFRMFKFRTMAPSSDPYDIAPNDLTDPRVTRVGRFLRRWSLDELPQLWNVICGQMSLIGPRPEMPFLVERYEPWQRQRLAVKPGLTCLWQVLGRKELPLHANLEYDVYYVRCCNWRLDLSILLRTLPAVISRRGAF